ncbi:TPA: TetR/AcrR family transcriptional regulator [Staphylococcus aureus]|nr:MULTISPECIES: TetR/AcrR family transcriptional regulator [Staphylococcus]AYY66231.1 TetR/AcrR family transcriptional regulator [Staphylococcus hominis]MDW4414082.1 TetR/AcrR family transcriptional regulator [Staphylococcus saprophyticus]RQX47418.1 TetR/AcrR family transcriptional regulator [Staphylococcus capitis]HCY6185396.1 TetR/AcrR family transcriptional regulator [Staphylococcus aureus]MDH8966536.1 TetR/AcrR family transcriptional regulator [Staphylococcus epidermidis]
METTFKLLETNYFDGISVQQICDDAEVNRSTFYRYFEDKSDLLYHLMQRIGDMFIENAKNNEDLITYKAILEIRCVI